MTRNGYLLVGFDRPTSEFGEQTVSEYLTSAGWRPYDGNGGPRIVVLDPAAGRRAYFEAAAHAGAGASLFLLSRQSGDGVCGGHRYLHRTASRLGGWVVHCSSLDDLGAAVARRLGWSSFYAGQP